MWQTLGILLTLGIVFYLLYLQGYMVVSSKRAVLFVGSVRGNGSCKASFSSCSGYMKRVMRFKESKAYYFTLDYELQKGDMEVKLLDASKQPIAILNQSCRNVMIDVDRKGRYYLVFTFKSASGNYELKWE